MLTQGLVPFLFGTNENCKLVFELSFVNSFVSQALPLVTVMLGSQTSDQDVSVTTLSEDADEPREIHFHLPTDGTPLSPGSPKWANYVKGVIQHYRGNGICPKKLPSV